MAVNKEDEVFYREFGMVLGALFVFFLLALFLARAIGANALQASRLSPGEVEERTAPVGEVRYGEPGEMLAAPEPAPAEEQVAAAEPQSGDEVYKAACVACHATGAAGAPKLGDKAAWEPRVALGFDAMVESAVNGKGVMPPKGGFPNLSDEEIENAVQYMLDQL